MNAHVKPTGHSPVPWPPAICHFGNKEILAIVKWSYSPNLDRSKNNLFSIFPVLDKEVQWYLLILDLAHLILVQFRWENESDYDCKSEDPFCDWGFFL